MLLTERSVAQYLVDRNLLRVASVVDHALEIADASRRNRNFKVIRDEDPCYLVKQGLDPDSIATIAHEAAVYQFLHSATRAQRLLPYLVRCYDYEPVHNILVLELVPKAQTFREYHSHRGRFSTRLAGALGRALGTLHSSISTVGVSPEIRQRFAGGPPGILFIHRPQLRGFQHLSSANLQLIRIVQQSKEFCHRLDQLRHDWQVETFIHSDVRWDNCVVGAQPDSRRATRLKVVDWEFAAFGAPCWDVGSVFANYLTFWLSSVPISGADPPERFLGLTRYPLERMQPAIRAFWRSYARHLGLDSAAAWQWLLRAVPYAAARLVQSAFEQTRPSVDITGNVVCLLQLALNVMMRPQEAIVQLLGICPAMPSEP